MRNISIVLVLLCAACAPAPDKAPASSGTGTANKDDVARWEQRADNVTITRDDWGIAHIHGKTDADAVFGMLFVQAEDDFNRVETNYINAMGRLAEAEGESEIIRDLRMKLFINPDSLKAMYSGAEPWLKALMDAYADGLNFYLYKHPEVKPRVITHFEPWMALSFSEGSIGGDIEDVRLASLGDVYKNGAPAFASAAWNKHAVVATASPALRFDASVEPSGSNGIAIAPAITTGKRALLLINPHTSFFFRDEHQVSSDEGLNVYGASTWGQFFVYQGFNENAGWMHTSSGADVVDEFAVSVTKKGDSLFYQYGKELRPLRSEKIVVPYKNGNAMAQKEFTVYRTHHGPIVRHEGDKWLAVQLMNTPLKALTQSFTRTKAKNLEEFKKSLEMHTNSSNNTLFADRDGNIAYLHANFVPKRNPKFDYTKPVDGNNPATDWNGIHTFEESPNSVNPPNGWVFNSNNWPYSAAGANSPKKDAFPAYFDEAGETPRGLHALRVLDGKSGWTVQGLIDAAYDPYLTGFAALLPPLFKNFDATPANDPLKAKVAEQVKMLREWDFKWSAASIPTSVAVLYGENLLPSVASEATKAHMTGYDYAVSRATAKERLQALADATDTLTARYGKWNTPWGEINRFQRLTDDLVHPFTDAGASIPVPFTVGNWGSLASFSARPYKGSKKIYGTSGNSFVAVVEFGKDSVRARAVTAGGISGNPSSKHFNDQAERYAKGDLREVYFYPSQLKGHTEKTYKPGQ